MDLRVKFIRACVEGSRRYSPGQEDTLPGVVADRLQGVGVVTVLGPVELPIAPERAPNKLLDVVRTIRKRGRPAK